MNDAPNHKPHIEIHTDGACSGNPGPGGWGALLRYGSTEKELSGGEPLTTNNRMELLAAIRALESLSKPCRIDLYTDSQYVQKGITEWMSELAETRLEERQRRGGEKPGSLAAPERRRRAASGVMALGQRP